MTNPFELKYIDKQACLFCGFSNRSLLSEY